MHVTGIVESRVTDYFESNRAVQHADATYDAVMLRFLPEMLDGHEVGDFGDAVGGKKASDKDVRIRKVVLLYF